MGWAAGKCLARGDQSNERGAEREPGVPMWGDWQDALWHRKKHAQLPVRVLNKAGHEKLARCCFLEEAGPWRQAADEDFPVQPFVPFGLRIKRMYYLFIFTK